MRNNHPTEKKMYKYDVNFHFEEIIMTIVYKPINLRVFKKR
jgi:hypothetical protein